MILTTYDSEKQESKEEVQQELTRPKECSSLRSSLNFAKQQLSQASKEDDGCSDLQKQAKEAQSSYDDAVSEATASQTKLNSISVKINNVWIAPFDGIVEVNDKNKMHLQ